MNSVVILFIADLDELFYNTLKEANHRWMESLLYKGEQGVGGETRRPEKDDEEDRVEDRSTDNLSPSEVQSLLGQNNKVQCLEDEVQSLKIQLQEQTDIVNKRLAMTTQQDDNFDDQHQPITST